MQQRIARRASRRLLTYSSARAINACDGWAVPFVRLHFRQAGTTSERGLLWCLFRFLDLRYV
jgi:hypothetical protein